MNSPKGVAYSGNGFSINDTITKVAGTGVTMIIVTHEIRFAKNVSDGVVFVDKGAILEQGTPQEVIDHPQTAQVQEFPQQDGAEITVTIYSTTLSVRRAALSMDGSSHIAFFIKFLFAEMPEK